VGALLGVLERPAAWWLALAGFLARGGLLLVAAPILVIHTPAGVQTELSPLLVPFLLTNESASFVAFAVAASAGAALALLVGTLVGAWSETVLVRLMADDEGDPARAAAGSWSFVPHVLAARWLCHLPLIAALLWGAARIGATVYRELTVPFEVVTPIAVRIATAVPDALVIVGLAWLLGEAAGGLAAREVVLGGRGVARAAVAGWLGLAARPLASLATLAWTTLIVMVAVVPGLLGATAAWRWLREVLWQPGEPAAVAATLLLFVALWLATLTLTGVAAALRSAAWTAEWQRRVSERPVARITRQMGWEVGTIGDGEGTRPEGWPTTGASGRL
jgi:hypothetical protein